MSGLPDRAALIERARALSQELADTAAFLESDEGWTAATRPAWAQRVQGAWAGWMGKSTPAMCWLYALQQAAIPGVAWALQRGESADDFDDDIVALARELLSEGDDRELEIGEQPGEQHAIAVARHAVSLTYPEHAGALTDEQVATALKIWARRGGPRPSSKALTKWDALAEMFEAAGITSGVGGHAMEKQWKNWNRDER